MTPEFLHTSTYATLMHQHISTMIDYLFSQNKEFAIGCNVSEILFTPELPSEIQNAFKETVLFIISNYSFESSKLEEGYFSFEAGFGEENFGATVTMPLLAIKQLFVGDNPIIINHAHSEDKAVKNLSTQEDNIEAKSSMEALLNNPQNQKFRRKLKK